MRASRGDVLRAVYFSGPTSRHELSGLTGLSPATVSNVTAELVANGILVEAGRVDSDGGRPRVLLRVDPAYGHVVGVDVGETKVRVELFDLAMRTRATAACALRPGRHDPDLVVGHIRTGVTAVLAEAGLGEEDVLGIGVGVPGTVHHGPTGAHVHARAFGWSGVPLNALLHKRVSLPAIVDNGAKASGQAELWFGAGTGSRNAVVALIGSGVGASIIIGGRLYRGSTGAAGEWGHTTIAVNGRACRCGARGCLEAYIGAEAVIDRYRETGRRPKGRTEESQLASVLAADDPTGLVEETVDYLGAGLANLIDLFDPERIVIGGWAGLLLGRARLADIRRSVARHALSQPVAPTTIDLSDLGADAVVRGSATLVIDRFLATAQAP